MRDADDPLADVIPLPVGGDGGPNIGPPNRLFDDSVIGAPGDPIIGPAGDAPATAQLVAAPRNGMTVASSSPSEGSSLSDICRSAYTISHAPGA